jgi:hypothetical protein
LSRARGDGIGRLELRSIFDAQTHVENGIPHRLRAM